MRILVVADVHANLAAFTAVIDAAGSFDVIWSLGDLIGYGPEPRECIELLRRHEHLAIAGNHDLAAVEMIGLEDFNPFAAEAARWTMGQLTEPERAWLRALPAVVVEGEFTLAHGSLADPVWDYLTTRGKARDHLALQSTPYSLVGHTHLPVVFFEDEARGLEHGDSLALAGRRFVANPGGVGQPRDGDPRAAFALLDTDAGLIEFRRVEYDIAATQVRMRAAGLPAFLIERLRWGR
jgi:diadenosine tetraphosphatase ApaH/serine/threonine PP2A family protein phosphatase